MLIKIENLLCDNIHFFFLAEDGIRDGHVTGVQTCALPIYFEPGGWPVSADRRDRLDGGAVSPGPGRTGRSGRHVLGAVALPPRRGRDRHRSGLFSLEEIGRASCRERV